VVIVTPREAAPAPIIERAYAEAPPPIIVEERRLTEDERIQHVVMDRLAQNPYLDGKIGVESRDSIVRLSGWTRTVGQARRAESEARSVLGVRWVENEIRPRVGGSV
jgi:hyperosmotically inducible periplasmic protein